MSLGSPLGEGGSVGRARFQNWANSSERAGGPAESSARRPTREGRGGGSARTVQLRGARGGLLGDGLEVQPVDPVAAVVELVPGVDDQLPVHPLRAVVRARDVVVLAGQRVELAPEQERLDAQLPRLERQGHVQRRLHLRGEDAPAVRERIQGEQRILVQGGGHRRRRLPSRGSRGRRGCGDDDAKVTRLRFASLSSDARVAVVAGGNRNESKTGGRPRRDFRADRSHQWFFSD